MEHQTLYGGFFLFLVNCKVDVDKLRAKIFFPGYAKC